jgi:hypothetical protein
MADTKKPASFTPASLSVEDVKSLGMFFKELLAENPLVRYSIYAAGIGGALEGLHILWLMVRYLSKF